MNTTVFPIAWIGSLVDPVIGRKNPRNKIHIPRGRQPELLGSTLSLGLQSCLTISNGIPPKRQLNQNRS